HAHPTSTLFPYTTLFRSNSHLLSWEQQKLAAGVVILSPFLPLLFMGEEYGETAPFLYFTSHGDPELVEAVRRGRKSLFDLFAWRSEEHTSELQSRFDLVC